MKYQYGDLVEVNVGESKAFDHLGWELAIVIRPSELSNRCWFVHPPPDLDMYCESSLSGQDGLWSAGGHRIRMAANPTDEEIVAHTAFMLTGEFVRYPNTTPREED